MGRREVFFSSDTTDHELQTETYRHSWRLRVQGCDLKLQVLSDQARVWEVPPVSTQCPSPLKYFAPCAIFLLVEASFSNRFYKVSAL